MEGSRKRHLAIIGFILVVAVFFTGFIYAVVFSSKEKSDWNNFQQRVADSRASQTGRRQYNPDVPILLNRDEVVSVGRIQLIYRGKKNRKIQIGVIIPALDPNAEYLHSIDAERAAEVIRLGGQYFRVVSSRTSKLKLERLKQQ
jgi:hypothetical protein